MKVKICDAICGKGKTSSVIEMMNSNTDTKYVFVTQFLSEVDRIMKSCSARNFVTPDDDGQPKLDSLNELLSTGENIATTHALFLGCTDETKRLIAEHGYTLVLDEVIDVISISDMCRSDMELLKSCNIVDENDGDVRWLDDAYDIDDERGRFRNEALLARHHRLVRYDDVFFFWSIPPELFTSFEDVYVLTYMFYAQPMKCFFDMCGIEYEYIGVKKENGKYMMCDASDMDRSLDLRDKIHILDNKKLNAIGNSRSDLSCTWYLGKSDKQEQNVDTIRRNVINVKKNIFKAKSGEFMWTAFKGAKIEMAASGLSTSFVAYNKRASNEYANRKYLAYCVNTFPRPWEARYYYDHGAGMDGDMYALSTLIQWIFRSAIRKGEEIWLYLPSARMRYLLTEWIKNLADGDDLKPVHYKSARKGGKKRRNIRSTSEFEKAVSAVVKSHDRIKWEEEQ